MRLFANPVLFSIAGVSAALLAGGCSGVERPSRGNELAGAVLPTPLEKPAFTLTATDGRPYDFRRETDGTLTLLFFGYTNCPDVCPIHLSNIAAVLRTLPLEDRSRVRVVFVTTDPARDTPPRLREWLDAIDPSFIGLSGPVDEVNRIQAALRLPPAVGQPREPPAADTSYAVAHAAQVIVFSPGDDRAHVVYPFGTRQRDWAKDLPILLRR